MLANHNDLLLVIESIIVREPIYQWLVSHNWEILNFDKVSAVQMVNLLLFLC